MVTTTSERNVHMVERTDQNFVHSERRTWSKRSVAGGTRVRSRGAGAGVGGLSRHRAASSGAGTAGVEVDAVAGHLHESGLERGLLLYELVDGQVVGRGEVTDAVGGDAVQSQRAVDPFGRDARRPSAGARARRTAASALAPIPSSCAG